MQDYDLFQLVVAALAGAACGFLNTVASSGSVVSLPILMWVGLEATEANATNRIPVLIGSIAATVDLAKNKAIPWSLALRISVPVTIGAGIGAVLAELLPSQDLGLVITAAVLVAFLLIVSRLKRLLEARPAEAARFGIREFAGFVGIGAGLGFIVLDGATYLLLALVMAVRLNLSDANAVKNFLLAPTTLLAMGVFVANGSVEWLLGITMGIDSIAGGVLGARLTLSAHARSWIVLLLSLVIVGELVHLSIHYYYRFLLT